MIRKNLLSKGTNMMNFLMTQDPSINPAIAAGIVGNLVQESTLNHTAENSLGYKGLAQWDPNHRWPAYKNWLRRVNRKNDEKSQLLYILEEPRKDSFDAVKKMVRDNVTDPAIAAQRFNALYERSGEKDGDIGYANRLKYSNALFDYYMTNRESEIKTLNDESLPVGWSRSVIGFDAQNEFKEVFTDSITINGQSLRGLFPVLSFPEDETVEIKFGSKQGASYYRRRL